MSIKEQVARLDGDLKRFRAKTNRRLRDLESPERRNGSISISSEVWNVLKWLILIVGALVGVNLI